MPSDPVQTERPQRIPLCEPALLGNEWRYVEEALDTNWVSSVSPFVQRFERAFGSYVGARHCVAVSSGTAALHLALLVAGVEPDDEVAVSSLTFVAPANAVRYVGAWPVFVDAEPQCWQLDVQRLADFLERGCRWDGATLRNRHTGRRVRAVIPVHILGHPVDMDPLLELARRYDLRVVEDATESLGARYKGRRVGCLGDIGCFSFNGNKLITTGGGGMVVTDREDWADRVRYLSTQAKDDPIEFVHCAIGYNYRLSGIQAAVGCAQLERVEEYVATKRRIGAAYAGALSGVPGLSPMPQAPWAASAFWMYTVLIDEAGYGLSSRALLARLRAQGIEARPLWQPLHRSPSHAGAQCIGGEVAERLNRDALSLPSSVGLTAEQQQRVIDVLRDSRP